MQIEILQRQFDMLKSQHTQALMERNMPEARRILEEMDRVRNAIRIEEGNQIIEKARESGVLERASRILSAVQILLCQANNMIGEVEDMFAENNVILDDIVIEQKKYYKAADKYFATFGKIVDENNKGNDMFDDIQAFDIMFREYAGMKKPRSLMSGCKKAAGKANGLSQMCQKCMITPNPDCIVCRACNKSFLEGFKKGAKWLEAKRIERILNRGKEKK